MNVKIALKKTNLHPLIRQLFSQQQWWLIGGAVVAHCWEQWWLIEGAVVVHW
jgi:hypothetical protein